MSLFNDLAGDLLGGGAAAGGNQNALSAVVELVNSHPGGVNGLIQTMHDQGLGDAVSSWVGNGQNLPISAEQIESVLSNGQVQQFASRLGVSPDTALGHLAQLLPSIVDQLTPNGKAPPQGGIEAEGLSLLQGFLAEGTAHSYS